MEDLLPRFRSSSSPIPQETKRFCVSPVQFQNPNHGKVKQMADKTYRVGIIGCGGMGRSHANNWSNTGRAEVVTASDISEASAAKFAEEFALPTHYNRFW